MAVFEKFNDVPSGIIHDHAGTMDAWANPNVRQANVLDDLSQFAQWFKEEQKKGYDKDGVPED